MGSLVQAVQGRSHQQYRVTSHRGQGALQGVKSECNQQVTGTMLRAVLMLSLVALSVTQRRPPPGFYDYEDANSGNSVQGRGPSMDVGQFPFKRGERPIFNFDQGDEGFIATIPELIDGLDKIKNVMNQQRKLPKPLARLLISARLADD